VDKPSAPSASTRPALRQESAPREATPGDERLGLALGLVATLLFSLTLPATRAAVPELGAIGVGIGRTVVAAVPAALYLVLVRAPLPRRADRIPLAIASLGVVIGFPLFSAIAMLTVPAGHGGVVLGILPLATAAAAVMIAGERPSRGFWLCGIAGTVAVVGFAFWQGAGALVPGDLALFAAVVSAAAGYAWSGRLARRMDGGRVIAWALVLALPVTLPVGGLALAGASWPGIEALAGFLYVALVSQFLAFFAWNRGLALGGVARVGQMQLLQPFVTLAASAALLAETITPEALAFAAIVVATVALGRRMPIRRT